MHFAHTAEYTTKESITKLINVCSRFFGEADGKMGLEVELEKIWSSFSPIFHAGAQPQRTCYQKVWHSVLNRLSIND